MNIYTVLSDYDIQKKKKKKLPKHVNSFIDTFGAVFRSYIGWLSMIIVE